MSETSQFDALMAALRTMVIEGLDHGYFRVAISGTIGRANRREVLIEAGKSHKFTIALEELPR